MGTPANILVWIVFVGAWFSLGPYLANHNYQELQRNTQATNDAQTATEEIRAQASILLET